MPSGRQGARRRRGSSLVRAIDPDTQQLTKLTDMWANKEINRTRVQARESRHRATTTKEPGSDLNRLSGTQELDAYIGQGDTLRSQWGSLNLDRQRAIVKTLVDHVEILPGVTGGPLGRG